MPDSLGAFKLHSDTPNSALNSHEDPSPTQPYCLCTHCTHLFSFNHLPEQGRSSGFHVQPQQSSRWSPTPAQLLYLEELYRQGTKTPTAQQIQQIASHLRQFGRIEGKNVFYWFQNHKARERQKRRRWEMETASASAAEIKEMYVMGSSEKQEEEADQGLRGTGDEVKETKKWASTSNCSGLAEVSASVLELAERGANVRAQFEEREIQVLRSNRGERQARCQNREMPCFTSIHLKNIATTATTSVVAAHTQTLNPLDCDEEEIADIRTLELFPHKRGVQDGIFLTERESKFSANASLDSEITSNQFFEFLPLKN